MRLDCDLICFLVAAFFVIFRFLQWELSDLWTTALLQYFRGLEHYNKRERPNRNTNV